MPTYTLAPSSLAALSKGKFLAGNTFHAAVPTTLIVEPKPGDPDPAEHTVVMDLDVLDGKLVCTRLEVQMRPGGPNITADALRRVPVARYIRDAVATNLLVNEVDPTDLRRRFPFIPPAPDFAKDGMTDEVLQNVARLYHWAQASGDAPLGVLERDYGVPRGKASRWISVAKRRGYIKDDSDGS